MMGTKCPVCHGEVMKYGQFFREAEPYKTSKCSNCGSELKRSPAVWILLASMIVLAALFTVYAIPIMAGWSLPYAIALGLLFFLALVFATNFIGWRYVGWRAVNPEK